jgi:integrase
VQALERYRGAYADSTLDNAVLGFADFQRWCAERQVESLPPAAETVAGYVDSLFPRLGVRTIISRVYAVRLVSRAMRLKDVTASEEVRLALRRGKRAYGTRPEQAAPINAALRDRLRQACPPTLRGLRDRAMISLGYDTLCRRSELEALRIEDIECFPDGTARVRVRREKQDPGGPGSYGYISAQGLRDVSEWLEAARLDSGFILRPVYGEKNAGKNGLRPCALRERIKKIALSAGVEPEAARQLSVQSLRIGAVQDLAMAGRSILEIMRAGRWRNAELVATYVRNAPVNVWRQSDGDGYPLAQSLHGWRARAIAARGPASKARRAVLGADADADGDTARSRAAGSGTEPGASLTSDEP